METCFNEPWLITLFKVLDQYPGDLKLLADSFFFFKQPAHIDIFSLLHKIKTTGVTCFVDFWFTRAL